MNLSRFERLLRDASDGLGDPLTAYCGMVGGIRRYREYFRHFDVECVETLAEERRAARYRVPGVGDVHFEVDADSTHLPVALASMVGKYVRELAMERMNRFYQGHDEALPRASGYHDPVTRRFIESTTPIRKRLRIAQRCFERLR